MLIFCPACSRVLFLTLFHVLNSWEFIVVDCSHPHTMTATEPSEALQPTDPPKDVEIENEEKQENTEKNVKKDEVSGNKKVYPPTKIVLPAMLAIYLVFFLVALVRPAEPTHSHQLFC